MPPDVFGPTQPIEAACHFTHEAMAAQFRVSIAHADAAYARQGAQAAFAELDRLEQELSRFVENSDIAQMNRLQPGRELQLGLDAFECLWQAKRLYTWTGGAFDVSVGPLYACWRDDEGRSRTPTADQVARAAARTGLDKLVLNRQWYTARVTVAGMRFDLGGIGKGYAVDRIVAVLAEWGLERVMIHGGGSSLRVCGGPVPGRGWPISFSDPRDRRRRLLQFEATHLAAAGSGLECGRHIIDPRPGRHRPVTNTLAAWALAPDATTADALSTAWMVMENDGIERLCADHPKIAAMILREQASESGQLAKTKPESDQFGIWRWGPWLAEAAGAG